MPNIRIKDIPTTASATVNGDFFAVDSNASTRKLDAFSPTFGGNVAVAGSLTAANGTSTAPSIRFTSATGSGFYRANTNSIGIVNNGIASGYIDGMGAGGGLFIAALGTNQSITLSPTGTGAVRLGGTTTATLYSDSGLNLSIGTASGGAGLHFLSGSQAALFGTTINSNNGRLQLAESTAIGGGIGFHSDTAFYRYQAGGLAIDATANVPALMLRQSGTNAMYFYTSSLNGFIGTTNANSLTLQTGTNNALVLDSSQNATFAKDVLLGTSGPSVPSTLSGRAPRQGLNFNRTFGVGVSNVTPFGTRDFTAAFWVRRDSSVNQQYLIGNDVTGCFYTGFRVNGNIFSGPSPGTANADLPLGTPTGRLFHLVLVRSAGVLTGYVNAVAGGTAADTNNYTTSASSLFAADSGGSSPLDGFGAVQGFYNRALTQDEVRRLYESGVPAAADINSASNTSLLTGANSDFSSVGDWNPNPPANVSGGKLNLLATHATNNGVTLRAGKRYRLVCTIDSITAGFFAVFNGVSYLSVATAAGAVSYEFNVAATTLLFVRCTGGDAVVDNMFIYPIGAVLAPDAAQTGDGLTWYDTSGNAANITLPANGVSWNVPFSGNFGGNINVAGNLTVDKTEPTITFKRAANTNLNIINLWTGGLADFGIGLRNTSDSDLHIYNYGTSNDALKISKADSLATFSGAITASGTITSSVNTNSGVLQLNLVNSSTGTSASSLFRFNAGTRTASLQAYNDTHATLAGQLRIGTSNGDIVMIPSGVATTTFSASGTTFGGNATVTGTLTSNGLLTAAATTSLDGLPTAAIFGATKRIAIGYNTSGDYGFVACADSGTTWKELHLNPVGGIVKVPNTSASTTTSTGALVVGNGTSGGLGVGGAINAGSYLRSINSAAANDTEFTALRADVGADGILGAAVVAIGSLPSATGASRYGFITCSDNVDWRKLYIGGRPGLAANGGQVLIPSTASSTSTSSGALVVSGGVGIGGNTYIGGNLVVSGTVVDPIITGTILEDIFTITDAAAFEVDPGNGSIQLITLGASRTPKATNFAAGESVTMMIDDGTAFTLTWTDATWGTGGVKWVGGSAPTLATTGYTVIQLWKVGTQIYGARVGDVV